ncbi:MAG: hypothetical protein RL563_2591 [Pseudomonadota bacterium]
MADDGFEFDPFDRAAWGFRLYNQTDQKVFFFVLRINGGPFAEKELFGIDGGLRCGGIHGAGH